MIQKETRVKPYVNNLIEAIFSERNFLAANLKFKHTLIKFVIKQTNKGLKRNESGTKRLKQRKKNKINEKKMFLKEYSSPTAAHICMQTFVQTCEHTFTQICEHTLKNTSALIDDEKIKR